MSFELLEEDDDSTLQEALAMIEDSYDEETPIMGEIPDVDPIVKDPNRVKERNRERDSRRRQRQKEERLQLEMQAERLEMYLSQLRKSGGSGARLSLESLRDSSELRQGRVEAELLNRSLRKAVAAEVKWSKSLRSVLSKRQTMETVSLTSSMLSSSQSKVSSVIHSRPATLRDDPAAVKREIMATMDRIYYEARATVNPETGAAASIPELSCHYNVRVDPKVGPTTQLTSETPLECTLDSARELLSSMFSMPDSAEPSLKVRRTRAKRTYTQGEIEKEFTVDLGGSRVNECLDGVGLLRRHNEEDCELIIWAAISFHHSGKISFRECSWMVAARSAPSSSESVVRVNYRLNAEKAAGCTYIEGEHVDQVRNHALGAIGAKMKAKNHLLQKRMLVETGRGDLASFLQ